MSAGKELEDTAASGQEDAKAPDGSTLKALGLPQPDFHSLVLDLGALSFVDTVCLKSLKNVRGWGIPRKSPGGGRGPSSLHSAPITSSKSPLSLPTPRLSELPL